MNTIPTLDIKISENDPSPHEACLTKIIQFRLKVSMQGDKEISSRMVNHNLQPSIST